MTKMKRKVTTINYNSQVLCTGGYPKPSLIIEDLKEDGGRGALVIENPRVTLLSNHPTNKHVMEDIAFRLLVALKDILDHQDFRDRSFVHSLVLTEVRPSQSLIIPHSLLVYRQCKKRCAAVLLYWLQSRQSPQLSHPLRSS
jgi:hypothetical protein